MRIHCRPQFLLYSLLSILIVSCTAPPPSPPVTPESGWKLIKTPFFSFAVPESFKEVKVQGVDSVAGQYEGDGIKLMFDYGIYSDNFKHWPKETRYETIEIGNETALIGTRETKDLPGVEILTQAYVKENSRHSNLAMGANCRGEEEADLVRKIFVTIRF